MSVVYLDTVKCATFVFSQVEDGRIQGLKLAIQKDEKELKQLEKNLKFRKKKGTTKLPSSFANDGLDCIFVIMLLFCFL